MSDNDSNLSVPDVHRVVSVDDLVMVDIDSHKGKRGGFPVIRVCS